MKEVTDVKKGTLEERLKGIRLIATDVDGVLTDGGILLSGDDEEMKRFSAKDASIVELAQQNGIALVLATGRKCAATIRRAKEMNAEVFFKHDLAVANTSFLGILKEKYQVDPHEIFYIGDDLGDIAMIRKVGVGATPSDGIALAKGAADIVLKTAGGQGVMGEIVEMLLTAQGTWAKATERFRAAPGGDFDSKI